MSHAQHAPPPAPPPTAHYGFKQLSTAAATPTTSKPLIDECLWCLQHPELQKACYLARVCAVHPPKSCRYRDVAAILQVGPTCGLTALSMLLGGAPPPERLLASAKELHYTNNGEMFSARNLLQLIRDHLMPPPINNNNKGNDEVARHSENAVECAMHEGRLNCVKVRDCLLAGDCIFVPYDPDFNHAPCLKFGHKAHWALIVGYLISDNDKFFVLARHGKAKNLAVWSLDALSESNSNLVEFAQPKGYPDCDFLLPPGGIGGDLGLKERAIIVKGLPNPTIVIR